MEGLVVSYIDPVQFGRLLESVEQLAEKLDVATQHVDTFNQRLTDIEGRWKIGKAGLGGLALGVGFAVWGIKDTLTKIAEWFAR